jgi:hypothetical protein
MACQRHTSTARGPALCGSHFAYRRTSRTRATLPSSPWGPWLLTSCGCRDDWARAARLPRRGGGRAPDDHRPTGEAARIRCIARYPLATLVPRSSGDSLQLRMPPGSDVVRSHCLLREPASRVACRPLALPTPHLKGPTGQGDRPNLTPTTNEPASARLARHTEDESVRRPAYPTRLQRAFLCRARRYVHGPRKGSRPSARRSPRHSSRLSGSPTQRPGVWRMGAGLRRTAHLLMLIATMAQFAAELQFLPKMHRCCGPPPHRMLPMLPNRGRSDQPATPQKCTPSTDRRLLPEKKDGERNAPPSPAQHQRGPECPARRAAYGQPTAPALQKTFFSAETGNACARSTLVASSTTRPGQHRERATNHTSGAGLRWAIRQPSRRRTRLFPCGALLPDAGTDAPSPDSPDSGAAPSDGPPTNPA